jgi:hypothetical protein
LSAAVDGLYPKADSQCHFVVGKSELGQKKVVNFSDFRENVSK